MIERYIHHLKVELPAADEVAAGARMRLADKFPRTALRRMTHLGLLIGSTLEGLTLGSEDALVYASTYAETRALEDFLRSFPAASPLLFQTSIHPGGVQQVLIGRQQSLARLWPLAGRARLVEQALLTALLEPAERVAVVGGEERGTWMLDQGMAAARPFAFALMLSRETAGAIGRVELKPEGAAATRRPVAIKLAPTPREGLPAGAAVGSPSLENFAVALAERRPLAWQGADGAWSVVWS